MCVNTELSFDQWLEWVEYMDSSEQRSRLISLLQNYIDLLQNKLDIQKMRKP